ncbi:1473_t:CDS:2 [Cetraspora pellucida]|uniref:1473_t:CDS:1 n=1 Tax=Cetraspora pellucida TaxID=1433469 RepID=A0ACA9KF21_9GLOM|nr:1473_t:CDS:2 [Cetraspora pellucida]
MSNLPFYRFYQFSNRFALNSSLHRCYLRQYHPSKKALGQTVVENDRDLIFEVLSTIPSRKEAQYFLNRFTKPYIKSPILKPKVTKIPSIDKRPPSELTDIDTKKLELKKNQFIDSLFSTNFDHVALIKIQGPFTSLNLKSVAKSLVHLQKLGLMSIVVLDNDDWKEMLKEGPARFNELKQWMLEDAANLSEAIEISGGKATPIYDGVFTLTNSHVPEKNTNNHYRYFKLPGRTLATDVDAKINVSLRWLKWCYNLGQIPLILPIALDGLLIQRTIPANSGVIELSRALSNSSNVDSLNLKTPELEPMKIIVINSEGGIPSEERKGAHVFINIQQEYDYLKQSYKVNPKWNYTHPTSLENLEMIKSCLKDLPPTSSAIMVPAYSSTALVSNLITDKPRFSSSLPLTASTTPSTPITVLRYGAPVLFHHSLSTVNISSFQSLIEASFSRKLNIDDYLSRLENCLDMIIVVGDYQGAVVVTMEDVEGNKKGDLPYLDKIAVAPNSQGMGIADILWKQLQTNYPNLLWRSRDNNIVNTWYFERSDGNFRIPGTHWVMFWYGSDAINKLHEYAKVFKRIPASFS